jgi:phenylacetate-CoA ligase
MDELLLRVEPTPEMEQQGSPALAVFKETVAKRIHTMLGLRAGIEVIAAGTYPRTDFKARRVIDDRAVFRELNQRLAKEQGR